MKLSVAHSKGSYDVEEVSLQRLQELVLATDLVVTDRNVHEALRLTENAYVIEPGEASKSIEQYHRLLEWLAERGNRRSRIVAVGGGVVGDLAGFAAATFMRGVELVQIPTSLLAMVDSSVGGKVAVDLAMGKNLVGAYWPPTHVFVPIESLKSLPHEEFLAGTAEVWKYGYIADPSLVYRLKTSPPTMASDDLSQIIFNCIDIKRRVVEEDERETTGRRAILNFGHTVGHAIELCQGYRGLNHGCAVAVGMVVETQIAEALTLAEKGLASEIQQDLTAQGLPTRLPAGLEINSLLAAMARDKKSSGNGLAFSFVSKIGECKLTQGIDPEQVRKCLETVCR